MSYLTFKLNNKPTALAVSLPFWFYAEAEITALEQKDQALMSSAKMMKNC